MSNDDEMKAELERLRNENENLKKDKPKVRELSLKVSQKGACSLYGMGRFPVTLYKEQWVRVLDYSDEIRAFLEENDGELKVKG